MQSRHVTGHPVEVPHSADRAVEVLCLLALLVEVHHLTDHPVEVRRLAAEMRRLAAEVRRVANCDVPCLPLGVRVLRFRCGLLLGPC